MREAVAAADVEAPAVKVAFDNTSIQSRVGKRIAFVRTEIFDGMKMAVYVIKGDLGAVF